MSTTNTSTRFRKSMQSGWSDGAAPRRRCARSNARRKTTPYEDDDDDVGLRHCRLFHICGVLVNHGTVAPPPVLKLFLVQNYKSICSF